MIRINAINSFIVSSILIDNSKLIKLIFMQEQYQGVNVNILGVFLIIKRGNFGVVLISIEFAILPSAIFIHKFIKYLVKILCISIASKCKQTRMEGLTQMFFCKLYFSKPSTFRFQGFYHFWGWE